MGPGELKEYLEIVLDMEKNLFLQKQAIDSLQASIIRLDCQRISVIPCPKKPEKGSDDSKPLGIGGIIILLIGISGCAFGSYLTHNNNTDGLIISIFSGVAVAVGTITCLLALISIPERRSSQKEYESAQAIYERNLIDYEKAVEQNNLRVEAELKYKATLTAELDKLKACYESDSKVLETIYARNVIFPKYRNFVMLCSIYEYICAGRCNSLGEAYNILELEIRMDRLVLQLDQIIDHLGTIINNQYTLYTAIQRANEQTEKLVYGANSIATEIRKMKENSVKQDALLQSQIEQIKNSSAITAYQAERAQKELHYMNRMNYLSGENDRVFFNNVPPN